MLSRIRPGINQMGGGVLLCVVAMGVTYFSPIHFPTDSLGTLLTSQAILQHGTVRLDAYSVAGQPPYGATYQFVTKNQHIYHYFPIGTALMSVPFVYLANLAGNDLSDTDTHIGLENILSAASVGVVTLLVYLLSRQFLGVSASLGLTCVLVFGSTLTSTLGTALWSINFATLFEFLVLLLIVPAHLKGRPINSVVLGSLLFFAYLCRPSTSVLTIAVGAYLLYRRKIGTTLKTVAVVGLGMCALAAFSWSEYHQWLPDYYLPQRLTGPSQFWLALYGNLFSPARGLFTYSPYFFLILMVAVVYVRDLIRNALFVLASLGFLLTLLTASFFQHWWGGWSFGYRLLTDAMPELTLMTLLAIQKYADSSRRLSLSSLPVWGFVSAGCLAITIHSGQGLYNESAYWWNDNPSVDLHPEYIFDWKYPQFLASPSQLLDKQRWHELRQLPIYTLGTLITSDSHLVLFENWFEPEKTAEGYVYRWSNGKSARLVFKIDPSLRDNAELNLQLEVGYHHEQAVEVLLNGYQIGQLNSQNGDKTPSLIFHASLLRKYDPNVIEFLLPKAVSPAHLDPNNGDTRMLGLLLIAAKVTLP